MEEEEGSGGHEKLEKAWGNIFPSQIQHCHLLVTTVACVVINLVLFHSTSVHSKVVATRLHPQ